MIHVPRMMIYERFMRSAEFDVNFKDIPTAIRDISNSYNWERHQELVQTNTIVEVPLSHIDMYVEAVFKATGLDTIFELGDIDIPKDIKVNSDTSWLPIAFAETKAFRSIMFLLAHQLYSQLLSTEILGKTKKLLKLKKQSKLTKIQGTLSDVKMHSVENMLNKMARTMFHFHMFAQEENNLFILTEDLANALLDTEFPTSTDYIKSPNRSFYLMFPPKFSMENCSTCCDEKIEFEGMFVNLEEMIDCNMLRISMYSKPKQHTKKGKPISPIDPVTIYWELKIPHGNNMRQQLRDSIKQVACIDSENYEKTEESNDRIYKYSNLAIQTVLYITSINTDAVFVKMDEKPVAKNRVRKFIHRELTQTDHTILGSTRTAYINGQKNNAVYYSKKDGTKVTRKLKHLVRVKGHWHSFWYKDQNKIAQIPQHMHQEEKYDDYGKKMVRCIKWVEPFYKGEGVELVKEYKLTAGGRKYSK